MANRISGFSNRKRMAIPVTGPGIANRLLIYTGIAVVEGHVSQDHNMVRPEVDIYLAGNSIADPSRGDNFAGVPFLMVEAVASVSLAAIGFQDNDHNESVTFAVDEAEVIDEVIDQQTRFVKIRAKLAAQGDSASILRLSYHANVLALAAPEDVRLTGFDLAPGRISTSPPLSRTSTGTVTISRAAPLGGVTIVITSRAPVPGLVSHPSSVVVPAGLNSATFQVTALAAPAPPQRVTIVVTLDGVGSSQDLTVGGT